MGLPSALGRKRPAPENPQSCRAWEPGRARAAIFAAFDHTGTTPPPSSRRCSHGTPRPTVRRRARLALAVKPSTRQRTCGTFPAGSPCAAPPSRPPPPGCAPRSPSRRFCKAWWRRSRPPSDRSPLNSDDDGPMSTAPQSSTVAAAQRQPPGQPPELAKVVPATTLSGQRRRVQNKPPQDTGRA